MLGVACRDGKKKDQKWNISSCVVYGMCRAKKENYVSIKNQSKKKKEARFRDEEDGKEYLDHVTRKQGCSEG